MRLALKPHPDFPSRAVTLVEVDVSRSAAGTLDLRYTVTGKIAELFLPAAAPSRRADGLWQHTCLEAFVRRAPDGPYYELNFSPSTEWATYRLGGYRSGMSSPDEIPPPKVSAATGDGEFELAASINLPLPDLPEEAKWQLGLSAIVEEKSGRKSYWALAHPAGDPDFHHPHCFALELAAATDT